MTAVDLEDLDQAKKNIRRAMKREKISSQRYELMMDELRDYRFYAKDMVHPSETAVNYIWEKFKNVWISNKSYQLMDEVDDVQKGLAHKPFNSKSATHAKFLENLEVKKLNLNK